MTALDESLDETSERLAAFRIASNLNTPTLSLFISPTLTVIDPDQPPMIFRGEAAGRKDLNIAAISQGCEDGVVLDSSAPEFLRDKGNVVLDFVFDVLV